MHSWLSRFSNFDSEQANQIAQCHRVASEITLLSKTTQVFIKEWESGNEAETLHIWGVLAGYTQWKVDVFTPDSVN